MNEPRNHDLAVRMAELARAAAAPRRVEDVLSRCHGGGEGADPRGRRRGGAADRQGRQVGIAGATSDLPHQLDELQMKYQRGAVRGGGT